MAITTRDQLIAATAAGRTVQFNKANIATAAGEFMSLFRSVGMPGAATAPGTAAGQTLSRTSVGAIPIIAPSGTTYITSFEGTSSSACSLLLADRLVETGALSGIVTTAQTVNSVALPARASGALDVALWLEVYTALGITASPTVTASYTNRWIPGQHPHRAYVPDGTAGGRYRRAVRAVGHLDHFDRDGWRVRCRTPAHPAHRSDQFYWSGLCARLGGN
jgi:hypothetical protein